MPSKTEVRIGLYMVYTETANAFNPRQDQARDALLSRVLSPSPVFTLHEHDDPERDRVEAFVAGKFSESFNAHIHEFMPLLLSMRCLTRFSGVIGMRKAADTPLFLERYLDSGIAETLSRAVGETVRREDIMEIGNLVAGRKGPSQFVFLVAMSALHEAGYRWITFTATQSLANNLRKLGFPMTLLADASAARLSAAEAAQWGSYYQTRPQVFAGSLDAALEIIRKRPLFRKAMALYRREIRRLARQIEGY